MKGLRQGLEELVFGDAHRLGGVAQGIFGHDAVLGLAEEESNGGLVVLTLDLGVDGAQVEVQLADMLGFEGGAFEFNDDITLQPGVVEEQIDEELVARDLEPELAADKGETGAQLEQEAGDVADEGVFNLPLVGIVGEAEEIEVVGIFECFLSQSGVGRREKFREIGDGCPLAIFEAGFDIAFQGIPRPAAGYCMNRIPLAICGLRFGEQDDNVEPGQLVSRLLTKSWARCLGHGLSRLLCNRGNRTVLREEAHVFDIAGGESFDIWEGGFEVSGDSGNDFRPPSLLGLALQNVTPDAVVEAHDLGIHGQRGATAGRLNAGFDLRKPNRIVGRDEFSGHGQVFRG